MKIRLLSALMITGLLSACGVKGPLYLPDQAPHRHKHQDSTAAAPAPVAATPVAAPAAAAPTVPTAQPAAPAPAASLAAPVEQPAAPASGVPETATPEASAATTGDESTDTVSDTGSTSFTTAPASP